MNECDRNGINGNCGFDCPVFLAGACSIADEMIEAASKEDIELYNDIYGDPDETK